MLTICIPCFNSLPTIRVVLNVLNFQDLYPKIIILDNGSTDGTFEALSAMKVYKWFKDLDIELRCFGQISNRGHQNINFIRHKFCELVKTKYLMFLDSDVLLPPYILKPLLEVIEKREDLGMLGLKYDVNTNHVKMGATILRSALAKNIKWKKTEDACECLNCAKDLLVRGFKVEHYDKQLARHLLSF